MLIEKPIAATLEEADALLAIARARAPCCRRATSSGSTAPCARRCRTSTTPRFIESDRLAPFNPRGSDVAVVLDLMIHDIDLVRTFVGGGGDARCRPSACPVLTPFVDIANARITFEAGAVANITASRVSRERMRKLRIFQQSGYLSLDLGAGDGRVLSAAHATSTSPRSCAKRRARRRSSRSSSVWRSTRRKASRCGSSSRRSCRPLRGEAPIAVTGEDGREALAVALTIVHDIERSLPRSRAALARAGGRQVVREILFVAGEVSGDLHAAGVAREFVARGAPFRLVGIGGDAMRDAGVELIEHSAIWP